MSRQAEDKGVFAVVAREGTYAVGREELVLIEQVTEDALELRLGEGREEAPPRVADEPVDGGRHLGEDFGVALLEAPDQLHELRVARREAVFDHGTGAERQQTHHRADLQPERFAARQPEDVVVEAVRLVPHVVPVLAGLVHRVGDPDEVLDELEGSLL